MGSTAKWRERISIDPAVHHGDPCISGSLVPVSVVVGSIADGDTFEQVLASYPQLSGEDIQAGLHYAAEAVNPKGVSPKCKRFYLQDSRILDDPKAEYMLRLMMAHDTLRSGFRWVNSSRGAGNPAQNTEFLVAGLAVLGWIHEAIKVLSQGWSSKTRYIDKSMLDGDPALEGLWDELKKGKSPRLLRVKRVRDQQVFHFDAKGASKALDYIRNNEPSSFPFFETAGSGRTHESRYPPAYLALASGFFDQEINLASLPEEVGSTTSMIRDISGLLRKLLQGMWTEMGLTLVERDAEDEH